MNTAEVTQAIYTRLNGLRATTLSDVQAVYTTVPQSTTPESRTPFPYIVVNGFDTQPDDTKDDNGIQCLVDVHTFSRSQSSLTWRAIAGAVYDALQKYTPPSSDPENGLTSTATFTPDEVILSTDPDIDFTDDVFAFTVPADLVAGLGNGGFAFNIGGSNGAVIVIDDLLRLAVYATANGGSWLVSTSGALSANDRVVVQWEDNQQIKAWVNSEPIHGTDLQQNAKAPDGAGAWSFGSNSGGWISTTTGTNGQVDIATDISAISSFIDLTTEQAVTGTWGNLTVYGGQTSSPSASVLDWIECRYDGGTEFEDPSDGKTWHVVQTFRVFYYLT